MVSKKTVAVIFGGQSSEHEVSRTSAVMMLQALDKEKYQVLSVGITKKRAVADLQRACRACENRRMGKIRHACEPFS